jgi:hypothetical protein
MWKLVKADYEYSQIPTLIWMSLNLILFTANAIRGGLEEDLVLILLCTGIIISKFIMAPMDLSIILRTRFQAGLPLPVRTLGIYRHLRTVAGWSVMMILLLLSSLISMRGHIGPHYIGWLLAKLAGIWIFAGFASLSADLLFCTICTRGKGFKSALMKHGIRHLLMLASIYAGLGMYLFTHLSTDGNHGWFSAGFSAWFPAGFSAMLVTFPGALSALILGLVLMAVDVYAFERRTSYLV